MNHSKEDLVHSNLSSDLNIVTYTVNDNLNGDKAKGEVTVTPQTRKAESLLALINLWKNFQVQPNKCSEAGNQTL